MRCKLMGIQNRRKPVSYLKLVLTLGVTGSMLVGCSSEEKVARAEVRENFEIVDTYDYDLVKVVVDDEKTPEELAKEILLDEMGLTSNDLDHYESYGISSNNGIFVNAAILDGSALPTVSGFDLASITAINNNVSVTDESTTYAKFNVLQTNREKSVASYNKNKELNATTIAEELAKKAAEQEAKIAKQKEEKALQDGSNSLAED